MVKFPKLYIFVKINLMRKYFYTLMAALVAVSISACKTTEEKPKGYIVGAYVTSWSDVMPDPSRVTHINYAFGHVKKTFDGVDIANEERLRSIMELKTVAPSVKFSLSIGGWGSGNFSEMAADPALRASFVADCARIVKEYGMDGIDLDWEYPTSASAGISASPDDTDNFTLLMKELREVLGSDKLLTLASVCSAKYIDLLAILPYIDFVNVMSYDMGYAPKHSAALYRSDADGNVSPVAGWCTTDEAIQAHLKVGIPADKLVLGMPVYGRGNETYGEYVDYRDKLELMEGDHEAWDEIARVPYYASEDGTLLFGFDNARSITEKCNYIKEHGLLGGMYWEYNADNDEGEITRTIAENLLGK